MAPPGPVKPVANQPVADGGAGAPPIVNPESLHPSPDKFKDSKYRSTQKKLIIAMEMLRLFLSGDAKVTEADVKAAVEAWTKSDEFSKDPDSPKILETLLARLGQAKGQAQVQKALGVIPGGDKVLNPPVDPKKPAEQAPAETGGFKFHSITLDTHFADEGLRGFPQIYTLGLIPKEGFTQNQSSDFYGSVSAEFGSQDVTLFGGAYYDHGIYSLGNPEARFGRAGVKFGMVEYGNSMVGKRGPGGGFHFSLSGRMRAGIGLGSAWCSEVKGSEASGAKCTGPSFQFSLFNESDLISTGYGPFELGLRLLPSAVYVQAGDTPLPGLNRLPLEFFATYHVNSPVEPDKGNTKEDLLIKPYTPAKTAMTGLILFTNSFRNHYIRKQEAAYQETRILSLADPFGATASKDLFGLSYAGSASGAVISGFNEGSMGYRLTENFRYSQTGDRVALGSTLGTEFLVGVIGVAVTPGIPDNVVTSPGKPVDPAKISPENEGITNLDAHAFRLTLPALATRDILVLAGSLGAFGDRNDAVAKGNLHFPLAHAGLSATGLVLFLTSGDWSGDGFFGKSIIGNQPPNESSLEIKGSRFDFGSQDRQFWQASAGAMLLSYGVSGLLDFGIGRFKYLDRENCENEAKENEKKKLPPPACMAKKPEENKAGPIQNLQVGLNTDARTKGVLTFSGVW